MAEPSGDLYFDVMTRVGEAASFETVECARFWAIAPRVYPRGVFKFRSIEEAQAARQRVADEGARRISLGASS